MSKRECGGNSEKSLKMCYAEIMLRHINNS